ncbi:alpha/beta fold hydrolase [Ochrobactrum sp. A-1]|uniref:alpha/beta fold hydrolase n=1 Tax=Ochrobactrum sp. A-1 TaxID=2920940 RepID=UPI001F0B5120|nr:alpha/beta fold hydrolase [Ochrobactrum sp. A-1]
MMKTPVLFLPGLLCDERLWRNQLEGLHDVADSKVANLTLDDTIGAMAERALSIIEGRFSLAALSMGGYVAFEILRRAPERVGRIALFDTSAAADSEQRVRQRKAGISSLSVGRFAGVTTRLLPQLVHKSKIDGPIGDELKAMAARVGGEAYLRQQHAILGRPDSLPLLPQIKVPTLVAVGDSDVLTPPEESMQMHLAITGSTYHVFSDCGHLPALEQPSETTALLRRWLQD